LVVPELQQEYIVHAVVRILEHICPYTLRT
jgi:hypothetical protein